MEYWTLAPNEGQSSGGHSAIRIDESVYHFEHRGDGLIQIRRDRRRPFERAYRGRGNRRIDVLGLDLPADVVGTLEESLRARTHRESILFGRLESLDEDLRFTREALEHRDPHVSVPALGIFEAEYGSADCLTRLGFQDPGQLASDLSSAVDRAVVERQSASDRISSAVAPWRTRQLIEATSLVEALRAIANCHSVSPSFLAPLATHEFSDGVWNAVEGKLRADLTRLVSSTRPDRGLALLLTWGRLQAAHESLDRRQVILLDSFDEDDSQATAAPRAWHNERAREAIRAREAALAALEERQSGLPLEPFLDRLERTQHDAIHAEEGTIHRRSEPIGILQTTRALERRTKKIPLPISRPLTDEQLRSRQTALLRAKKVVFSGLQKKARYSLMTQNCVTELLEVLDDALAENASTADFAQDRRGDIESPLSFVPVAAHRIVARNAPIKGRERLLGTRELAIERERAAHAGRFALGSRVRESSPRTSKHYEPHPADSTFLFFTDRTIWTRPLAGLANIVTSTLVGTAGLITLPFDRGQRLRDAAMGFSMSVPELFFFNIRKGSYPITPPASLLNGAVNLAPGD